MSQNTMRIDEVDIVQGGGNTGKPRADYSVPKRHLNNGILHLAQLIKVIGFRRDEHQAHVGSDKVQVEV